MALALVVPTAFYGCKESGITPGQERNYYLEPYGATAEELQLQKEFYNTNNVYLLFNDLIERRPLGLDSNGEEVFSDLTVDLGYRMTTVSSYIIFEYEYLKTLAAKKAAAEFITEKFLPSLSPALRPFSFLLVDKIKQYGYNTSYSRYDLTNPSVYSGWRATAVAVAGVDAMTEAQQVTYKRDLLKSIINKSLVSVNESIFDEFHAVSAAYYDMYSGNATQQYPDLYTAETLTDIRYIGLLGSAPIYEAPSTQYPYGRVNTYNTKINTWPTRVLVDVTNYINLVFSGSDAEIRANNAGFPLVIRKYEMIREIIIDLGVVLD